jgi:exodeoxyribonuclease VII small subunit
MKQKGKAMKARGEKIEGQEKSQRFTAKIERMSFEDALSRLEEIVETMEDTSLPLADTMDAYEEGILLTKHCRDKLNEAAARIEVLEKDNRKDDAAQTDKRISKSGVRAKKVDLKEENGEFMVDERLQGTLLDLDTD